MQNSANLLEKVKDYKPQSNPSNLRDFLGGSIHLDFQNEVLARIEQMRDYNESCKSNEYLETRGGLKFARDVLTIFEDLLNNRLADLESEQEEKHND